jgi:hypothetical protein
MSDIDSEDIIDFYKSIDSSTRSDDIELLHLITVDGVVPRSIRYGVMNNVRRGVAKSVDGKDYYFNYVPGHSFKLVPASDQEKQWEANRVYKACKLGCDLYKSESTEDPPVEAQDDHEDEEKAVGSGGGQGSQSTMPSPVPEEQAINEQNHRITEEHPGAAGGSTPDQPGVGRDWHGTQKSWTAADLLKSWGDELQASTVIKSRQVDPKEAEFMTTVLNKSKTDVQAGRIRMTPVQRQQYNHWLSKSLDKGINRLSNWLEKKSG